MGFVSFLRRAWPWLYRLLLGDDIFISYARADATDYALALAVRLKRFVCYLDQIHTTPGSEVSEELAKVIRRSTVFVLVGTAAAASSGPIAEEIRIFARTRRPFIPIDVDGNLDKAAWYDDLVRGLAVGRRSTVTSGRTTVIAQDIGIPETAGAVDSASPSEATLTRIANAFTYTRRRAVVRNVFAAVTATSFLIIAGTFYWSSSTVSDARADAGRAAATATAANNERNLAQQQRASAETARAEAVTQENEARARAEAEQTRAESEVFRANREEQRRIELTAINAELDGSRLRSALRLAMADKLASDPVLAYRLAEHAYTKIAADADNARFLMNAASLARAGYRTRFSNCVVGHVSAPYVLLRCGTKVEHRAQDSEIAVDDERWKILDMQTGSEIAELPAIGDSFYRRVWIVPAAEGWRVVVADRGNRSSLASRMDPEIEVSVLDLSGSIIRRTQTRGSIPPTMCGVRHLVIDRYQLGDVTILDTLTGDRRTYSYQKLKFGPPHRPYEMLVSCTLDGKAFLASGNDFVWFQAAGEVAPKSGQIVPGSKVDGYEYADDAQAVWSPDERSLAVVSRSHIAVFDAAKGEVAWTASLDRYATVTWATADRLFIGRPSARAGHEISEWDRRAPGQEPRIVGHSERPLMTISPAAAYVSRGGQGVQEHFSVTSGDENWSGVHSDLLQARFFERVLLTQSPSDVRIWSLNAPLAGWVFSSTPTRRFLPCAGGDPNYRWIAAGYRSQDEPLQDDDAVTQTLGVEFREVAGLQRRSVILPPAVKNCQAMAFSLDGRWLVVVGDGIAAIVDVTDWSVQSLPLDIRSSMSLWPRGGRMHVYHLFGPAKDGPKERALTITPGTPTTSSSFPESEWGNERGEYCDGYVSPFREGYLLKRFDGWQSAIGISPSGSVLLGCSGWVAQGTAPAARGIDLEFIPTDLSGLMSLYGTRLAVYSAEELTQLLNSYAPVAPVPPDRSGTARTR